MISTCIYKYNGERTPIHTIPPHLHTFISPTPSQKDTAELTNHSPIQIPYIQMDYAY